MAKLLSGEIRSLPHLSASFAGPRKKLKPGQDPISSRYREPSLTTMKEKTPARRRRVSKKRYNSDDDYDESDASDVPDSGVRVKPTQAALQTQKMLEESGSGRYWGAVYSLNGERVGMSYVGSNLQNVTVRATGSSSTSVTDHSSSPSRQRKNRVYVGRWQDTWGFRPEILDDSHSENGACANKRSRNNKGLGRARFHYVGNQNFIRAWRKSQSKTVQRLPVTLPPPSDDADIHGSPSDPPSDKSCDPYEATDAPPNDDTLSDGEGEGEGNGRNFWFVRGSSPQKTNLPILPANDISRPGLGNANNVLDACPTSALESCGQLVTPEGLVKAVASGLQAVGTTVLLP